MLNLSNLKPKIQKKARKRVGRGSAAGGGTYGGRGLKGQKARSGGNIRPGFEGGRMTAVRQSPKKKGFRSQHPKNQVLPLAEIAAKFPDGAVIDPAMLHEKHMIRDASLPVKILGGGKIAKKLEFKEIKMSASARDAVLAAGGKITNVQ